MPPFQTFIVAFILFCTAVVAIGLWIGWRRRQRSFHQFLRNRRRKDDWR